jgi:hypothetical protein
VQDEAGVSGFGIFFAAAQVTAASGRLDAAAEIRLPAEVT